MTTNKLISLVAFNSAPLYHSIAEHQPVAKHLCLASTKKLEGEHSLSHEAAVSAGCYLS